ncbi:unnamed protein product [Owenia fusiformis]|uniref:Peptidase M14 domain-containing protein n=1 Tax=Owenia fusiformis TaxID=6347 RepID=A0A8J1XMG1_OWEFU|nr:unnamed protein product [Owenia fusiformis]
MDGLLVILSLFLAVTGATRVSYEGYRVLEVFPTEDATVHFLHDLYEEEYLNIDFWSEPRGVFSPIIFHVNPIRYDWVTAQLDAEGIKYTIIVENLQSMIDAETERLSSRDPTTQAIEDFADYHRFDEMMSWITNITTSRCGGNRCSLFNVGTSFEGRSIRGIKIGTPGTDKRAVWVDCGIHAREWIAPATCTYFIWRLSQDYDSDAETRRLVDTYDWYIQPVVNPDGYEYTWDVDRLWRKTRSNYNDILGCIGTDGNRNYDSFWGSDLGGASNDPCSNTYHGPSVFSEPECAAQRDFMTPLRDSFIALWTMHSRGQWMLHPWGNYDIPENEAELDQVGQAIVDAIFEVHGVTYIHGQSAVLLYPTQGSSNDWAYAPRGHEGGDGLGIEYAYTPELRPDPNGEDAWLLPPEQIRPVGEECWAGLKAMVREIESIGLPP